MSCVYTKPKTQNQYTTNYYESMPNFICQDILRNSLHHSMRKDKIKKFNKTFMVRRHVKIILVHNFGLPTLHIFFLDRVYSRVNYLVGCLKSYNFIRSSRRVRKILFKMVAQKITCPSRSDDFGSQYDTNIQGYGFFTNDCQNSQYFESGRDKSFKARARYERPDNRRKPSITSGVSNNSRQQLFRGKGASLHVFLKTEPLFEDTMLNESGCELFQGLEQWCSEPAKEEPAQTDFLKNREDNSHYTDTLHTRFSPPGWDGIDASSPTQAGFYTSPTNPLSPNVDGFALPDNKLLYQPENDNKQLWSREPAWDIPNLPVLIGDLAPEELMDLNPGTAMEPVPYCNTQNLNDTIYTNITAHKMMLTDEEDSFDAKMNTVAPREVENITEYILNDPEKGGPLQRSHDRNLSLNLTSAPWIADALSTPEVLNYVDQLEREKYILPISKPPETSTSTEIQLVKELPCSKKSTLVLDYDATTPQSGSYVESDTEDVKPPARKRGRRNSEDSDETYIPEVEHRQRKPSKRKLPVPLKDMIQALEESQPPKARRGRPPKKERRESTVSSVGSIDDNASAVSLHEMKWRIDRDKNNEASKRSRMNRKLKELQMEQLAIELEERNKKLKVKADILEDMTKKLKDALMTAILQK